MYIPQPPRHLTACTHWQRWFKLFLPFLPVCPHRGQLLTTSIFITRPFLTSTFPQRTYILHLSHNLTPSIHKLSNTTRVILGILHLTCTYASHITLIWPFALPRFPFKATFAFTTIIFSILRLTCAYALHITLIWLFVRTRLSSYQLPRLLSFTWIAL